MSHLEDLLCEYYDWQGYIVRRNIKVGRLSHGGFVVAGLTGSFGAGPYDVWLIRTDAQGDTLWTRTYGGSDYEYGESVQQTRDGGFVVVGYTESFGAGSSDVWLIRTEPQGDTLWTRTYGGRNSDVGYSVQQIDDGGFVVAGRTGSFGAGYSDVWLIRIDSLGNTAPLTITHDGSGLPAAFALEQNYPNPFNPSTTIGFDLPEAAEMSLIVYDLLGREVIRLVDGHHEAGHHQLGWNGRDGRGREVPTGLYIARMFVPPTLGVPATGSPTGATPGYVRSIKLVLLK